MIEERELKEKLKMYKEIGHKEGEGNCLLKLAKIYHGKEKFETAIEHYNQSLEIYEILDEKKIMADISISIGTIYQENTEYENALESFQYSYEIYHKLGNEKDEAASLINIAEIYRKKKKEKALNFYLDASKKFKIIGERKEEANTYILIGNFFKEKEDWKKSLEWYKKSTDIFERIYQKKDLAETHSLTAEIYIHTLEFERAVKSYKSIIQILGDSKESGEAYINIGKIFEKKKNFDSSLDNYQKALKIFKKGKNKNEEAQTHSSIANVFQELGNIKEALESYKTSAEIFNKLKNKEQSLHSHLKISNIYKQLNQFENEAVENVIIGDLYFGIESYNEAIEHYQKAEKKESDLEKVLEIIKKILDSSKKTNKWKLEAEYHIKSEQNYYEVGKEKKAMKYYSQCKEYYYSLGRPNEALNYFQKVISLHQDRKKKDMVAEDYVNIAKIYRSMGEQKNALILYKDVKNIHKSLGKKDEEANDLIEIGNLQRNMNDYKSAEESYKKALEIFKNLGNKNGQTIAYANIEKIYYLKAKSLHIERSKILKEINNLNKKISDTKTEKSKVQRIISEINKLIEEKKVDRNKKREFAEELVQKIELNNRSKNLKENLLKLREEDSKIDDTISEFNQQIRNKELIRAKFENEIDEIKEISQECKKEERSLYKKILKLEEKAQKYHHLAGEINHLIATITKLESVESEIYNQLAAGKIPKISLSTRTKTNIEFDESNGVFKYGSDLSYRSAKAVDGANMLLRTAYTIEFLRDMIQTTLSTKMRSSTLREMYYISEGWGKFAKFSTQQESDKLIEDLEIITKWMRENFMLRPEEDGARVIGDLVIREKNRKGIWKSINCKEDVGDSGYTIPYNVEKKKIEFKKINADFIIAIETGGMFDRLVENGFDENYNVILVHLKGQPARSTRRFIKRLSQENQLPVVVFTDGDPWSYRIFASVAYGAIKTAHISQYLATPSAEFIGITPSDIVNYNLPTDKLSVQDRNALEAELTDPRFSGSYWQNEIKYQLELGKKSEQQALAKHGLDYVTDTYLPEKLGEIGLI